MIDLNKRSKELRRKAIDLARAHGGTHFGGTLSCIEILTTLYDDIMKKDDQFVLSKGHGCWGYYALLQERGFTPRIESHPHADPKNGIYCTTGSLGHGLPFALGLALSKQLMFTNQPQPRVYVLMGDGECQEGTTWETLLLASALRTANLTVIIDYNQFQAEQESKTMLSLDQLFQIAQILKWEVASVDGHDTSALATTLNILNPQQNMPVLIIAKTIKGRGVSFMENNPKWHSQVLTPDLYTQAMKELS